jgi:hypothetical protein
MTYRINAVITLLALISLAASFYPEWGLWGLDSPRSQPSWLRIILVAIIAISSIPIISHRFGDFFRKLESWSNSRTLTAYLTLCVVLVGLFIILSSQNHLLGDGYNLAANIGSGNIFSATELLDYLWHYLINTLTGIESVEAFRAYAYGAYFAGLILLAGIYFFCDDLKIIFLQLAVLMSFTTFQFFFGYVESYTYAFVFVLLYFLSGQRDLSRGKISGITIALLIAAIGFHLGNIIFLPTLIYLASKLAFTRKTTIISLILLVIASIITAIYLGKYVNLTQILSPLTTNEMTRYSLFSWQHLHDLLNLLFLNTPLLLLLPFILKYTKKSARLFYICGLIAGLVFMFSVDPKIGAYRDWDLMAIASAPIIAFLFHALSSWKKSAGLKIYSILIPLVMFSILHTGSWVWQNTHKQDSYLIIKQNIQNDIHYTVEYYDGYRNKSWGLLAGKYYNDHNEALRAWHVRYDGDPNDGSNIMFIAKVSMGIGDTAQAFGIIDSSWHRFLDNMNILGQMIHIQAESNRWTELMNIYTTLIDSNKVDFSIYYDYGTLMSANGNPDSAMIYYDYAYQSLPDTMVDNQFVFYINAFVEGYDTITQNGLMRIYEKLAEDNRRTAGYILNTMSTNNSREIDTLRILLKHQRDAGQSNQK